MVYVRLRLICRLQTTCKMVRCPLPYMGGEQPGAPVNPNIPPLGKRSLTRDKNESTNRRFQQDICALVGTRYVAFLREK